MITKVRLIVKRSWGQISVKDFKFSGCYEKDGEMVVNYAKETWKDIKVAEIQFL